VTAVSPSSGTTFGGTTITITGSGFAAGVSVQVGGTPAVDISVVNSTTITAKTPAHAAGTAEVRVSVASKASTLPNAFTFVRPVVGANTPPVVGAITVQPPRAQQPLTLATIGDRITLTASVNDAETPVSDLTYEWTANPALGTFSGTGPSVQWTAPATTPSPQLLLLLLTVVERYQEPDPQGLPINREHRVQQSVVMKVHDSVKEIGDMAVDFLQRFADSNQGHESVLRNFSRTCDGGRGYADELQDVVDHRAGYTMTSHTIGAPVVTFAFGSTVTACDWTQAAPGQACAKVPVVFNDIEKSTGKAGSVSGNDYVSAVYESARWFLCHSKFEALTSTRAFHPFFHSIR
jgi:hypothetical protein